MYPELIYETALTLVPNIGEVRAKNLIEHFGDAPSVFKAPVKQLEAIEGIGSVAARSIKKFTDFKICEDEVKFIEKNNISPLFITNKDYPQRLLNCYDNPVMLYYKGNTNLNAPKIVSVAGTRTNTEYGKSICEKLIAELAAENVIVVSGLAFGIDTIAHKAALKNNLKTIGVMAHGLDKVYPAQNKELANNMLLQGGLLTDFMSGTNPDRQNFPRRNRIIAGMCDALVIVESSKKGGSLITAELANSYNKDVFAVPGRATDINSEGCNYLIKNNKSLLITCANDLLEIMNWKETPKKVKPQRELFVDLSPDEKKITDILAGHESVQIDKLYLQSGLSSSAAANALLMLEMQGVIVSMPGKLYKLL